ncbi:Hypothetical protein CINCED_3A009069 [Cinara cedri]|uniref:Coiled-coil domain-containing protein 39 n=1 Tax=Cinara cedri TaxID=506608 RepID=A0A5E4NJX1_9HEMI|nr:Hypothetical protein CINCED_3A009069 [Cinara cedri]
MADSYTDIMKEIGCGDGFHLPIANEENKLIENEIKELLKKKAKLLLLDESLDDDLLENKNTIKNLSTQEAQNQKLVVANRKQYEMEEQRLMVAQRENENLSRENKTAAKQLNEFIDDQTKLENELTQNDEQINKLRETIEWGEETLLAWNNDLAKQDTNINILETYNLEENHVFKNLEIQRQCLQRMVLEKESIVEQEITEFYRIERELEQTISLTRRAQNERNRLIEHWENAAKFLDSNQKETRNLVQKINKINQESREMYDNMTEIKLKYQNYLDANEELEYEIGKVQKINNDLKLSNFNQLAKNDIIQSQVLTAQIALNVLDNKLANERTKRKHMQNEQEKLKIQIQQKDKDIAKLIEDILKIKNKSMTQEEKINELYKIQENHKVTTEQLQSEKNKVLNMVFNVKIEITQLQSKIDLLTNQLHLNRKEQMELSKEELRMKESIMKNKEESYNLSYRLETIRTKMSEAKGTVDVKEMEELQEVLQTVNNELTQTINEQSQLKKQLKSAESESRRITKEIEKNAVELGRYKNRVEELSIRNEGGEKQIQLLEEQCNRNRIEDRMMKFKVEQIKKMMDNECEKVYSLAQQRDEINADINRRKADVADTFERISVERKLLSEEKSSAKRKLDALTQYIEQRKNKYEILTATMGNSNSICGDDGDEDQTSFTLSEHRIRLAQEKLELQDVGDELDERVQKLETNIRAMENTVILMNVTNNCYKAGLTSSHPLSRFSII